MEEMTIEQQRALAIASARLRMQEQSGEKVGGGDTAEGMSWGDVATGAVTNFIPSTVNIFKGMAQAIASPIETAKGVMDIGAGALQNALPTGFVDLVNKIAPSESAAEARKKAALVGQHYVNRYGSVEGFKKALAEDPAGIMADAATVLSGGAGLARGAGMTKVGEAINTASRAIDPVRMTVNATNKAVRPLGSGMAEIIGGMGTHTGGESIRQVAKAGYQGGTEAATAASMMRDKGAVTDLLDEANNALAKIKAARSAKYTNSMKNIAADKTVLKFDAVDNAVQDALNIKRFKGKSISPSTTKIQDEIVSVIDDWKKQNPADFHTAEGLDALKQTIGDIRDATEFGTPSRKVADSVYAAVKNEIVKQAPDYASTMQKYSEASELISEIQRHLLGKDKGSPTTAVNKLQKLMTASGKNKQMEMSLAKELEAAGAKNLMPGLAGLSLQGLAPRGLAGQAGIGLGGLGIIAGNPGLGVPFLAMQSPRLMGESALGAGRVAGTIGRTLDAGKSAAPSVMKNYPLDLYLYQAGMLGGMSEEQQ
jgi:hypothetical protein